MPSPAVRQFREIVLWPLELAFSGSPELGDRRGGFAALTASGEWREVESPFAADPDRFSESSYFEFVAFLPYVQRLLWGERGADGRLGEIRHALAPGGALVVSECVRLVPEQTIYAEFVFNLLESFRSPVLHPVRRPNGGFLAPEHWRAAMEAAGLDDVRLVPDVDTLRDRFPQFNVAAIGATRPG